jgi:hypothetical protein
MSALVTDQFRIVNANNFVSSLLDVNNSYYVFLGLSNPGSTGVPVGFGRTTTWDASPADIPSPVDNFQYLSHYKDTMLFGKKIGSDNVRRVIRRIDWSTNTRYEMYRHDYSVSNLSPNSGRSRLYDTNYYVMNSDFKVYICIDNGSSGTNPRGNISRDEPKFVDLEPSLAGNSGDGYIWKYLFTVNPSDIIKFDTTEYIVIPNDWETSTDPQIVNVRETGNSFDNNNQIKKVYIEKAGNSIYTSGSYKILGDGSGGEVEITANNNGQITDVKVISGGSGYTWAQIDLRSTGSSAERAKLIPIIPPSNGHGYDIYTELGSDKILIYSRFDDSTKDFPVDTKFAQVGILQNPKKLNSRTENYTESSFSSLYSLKLDADSIEEIDLPEIGEVMEQDLGNEKKARGYVVSYDKETNVLKYYQDRSLYFDNTFDQTDNNNITNKGEVLAFKSSSDEISPFGGSINTSFSGITTTVGSKQINLGVTFQNGLAQPEINKSTGKVIYIDNRSLIERDSRQKEDVKIILEF